MASTEGGMDIEEVAARHPEKIIKETVDPALGLLPFQGRKLAVALGLKGDLIAAGAKFFGGRLSRPGGNATPAWSRSTRSASSPDADGKDALMAVDAKISLDDNALYRHPDIQAMRDLDEEEPLEIEASKYNLNYIELDGNIACLVNGAGLAMATMDIIKHFGGNPANFLDVGGGASKEQVAAAFKIILTDPKVKGILVNIFGGIMDCNVIATGHRRGGEGNRPPPAAGRPPGGQQRRRRQADARRLRPQHRQRRLHGRRRAEDRPGSSA